MAPATRDAPAFCRQCKADFIGTPDGFVCGTCGLPASAPEPEPAAPKRGRGRPRKAREGGEPAGPGGPAEGG